MVGSFLNFCMFLFSNAFFFFSEKQYPPVVPHFDHPFRRKMTVYEHSVDLKLDCPSDEEKIGQVHLCWKGPMGNVCFWSLTSSFFFSFFFTFQDNESELA